MIALTETRVAAVETMIYETETKVVGFARMVEAIKTWVGEVETMVLVWIASLSLAMTGVFMVGTMIVGMKRGMEG